MTDFHPIDKPTEPGWYWWKDPVHGSFFPSEIKMVDGKLLELNQRDGGYEAIADGYGTWFGPKIEPPVTDGPTQGTRP